MMLRKKLGRSRAAAKRRNGGNVARGVRQRSNRSDGLYEIEDGWFICMLILCIISWMMLFISSLLLYVHKPFREEGPWQVVWTGSFLATLRCTVYPKPYTLKLITKT
eukprot:Tamp_23207.p2 GENE.Tamp_23207~~Tamp_23207.p2  ORF type:complete len:107 (-),score=6.14 Tamp_23207:369-689(-)